MSLRHSWCGPLLYFPWYRVLVHDATHESYVAERNLEPDTSGAPVRHPMIDRCVMANDLADFQAEALARGYAHDFALDVRSAPADFASELRVVEYRTFDTGTDPGDDVTMYLIESRGGPKGYLILADSFHSDPRKAAFIDALLSKRRVNG